MLGRRNGGWVATSAADARAVLSDDRLGVPGVAVEDAVGTVRWLRAQVSRFANGPEHARRRREAERELARVRPADLAARARAAAEALIAAGADPVAVARRAPTVALAGELGLRDPAAAADAVLDLAPAYFPGADAVAEARGDEAVRALLRLLGDLPLPVALARITLLVQGCEATGALIDAALAHGGPLAAVLRERPPLPAIRRVARTDTALAGAFVRAGDEVIVDVAAASDPDVLTFGAGRRPCPASEHALAAAEAVLDILRSPTSCPGVARA